MTMCKDGEWVPEVLAPGVPVYLAIVEALEADILCARLRAGVKLPPQRVLAQKLGIDFTTVSRAYSLARKRELVEARVGRGTFVCEATKGTKRVSKTALKEIDMGMNIPPLPDDPALMARLKGEMAQAVRHISSDALFGYHDFIGAQDERKVVAQWMKRRNKCVDADTVLICPGTQSILLALLTQYVRSGDMVACEYLAYPGFKALCQRLDIACAGLSMDEDGISVTAFRQACRENKIRILYCTPTLHNPTCTTWSLERRKQIAEIAREFDVLIVEDDAYGFLCDSEVAPLSEFAPERSFYIAGLAKCFSSGMRVSFLSVPEKRHFQVVSMAMRAVAMMVAAPSRAMVIALIESGCLDAVTQAIREETKRRQIVLRETLAADIYHTDPTAFHIWLKLPEGLPMHRFAQGLQGEGIRVVCADVFALTLDYPNAVRLCLGVPENADECRKVLETVKDILESFQDEYRMFV